MEDRHIACTMTAVMLPLLRAEAGEEAVTAVLERAGSTRSQAYLESTDNWISLPEAVALLDACCAVTGDAQFARRVGEEAVRRHAGTAVATLLRSLGSPEAVLGAIATTASKFSTTTEMAALESAPGFALVRARTRDAFAPHPLTCQWRSGLLSTITMLFGMPLAEVRETACQCHGAPACRYEIRWDADQAAVSADPQQRVTALEAQLLAMQDRLRGVFATASDLLSVDDLDIVLARIVERAAGTVRAPRYVLAVRPGGEAEHRLYTDGVTHDDAQRIARAVERGDRLSGAVLAVEVASSRRHYGHLVALTDEGSHFFPQERELLELYAKHAAAVLDMATALDESARRHDHVSALLTLAQALASTGTSQEVADCLAEVLPTVVDCDRLSVMLWDPAERCLRAASTSGMSPEGAALLRSTPIRPQDSPGVAHMAKDPRPLFFDPGNADPFLSSLFDRLGLVRMVAVPIIARGEFLGVLTVSVVERPERLRADAALIERLTGVAALAAPAIQNGRLVDALRHQAAHDPLTGLANRAGFGGRMTRVIERAGDAHVGLLFVDLDGFKQVNDLHGHAAGDQLLQAVARRLLGLVRLEDTVARLGGDEFAVILTDADSAEEVSVAAARVREAIAEPFDLGDGIVVTVGASVGEARWPADGAELDALLRHADAAMYREKSRSRSG
jgi:diguanylate cyclase (GGDEF)-like protein